ncbi:hypothetical protein AB0L75_43125 [Streptomyces sp. NPDC052101]
MIASFGLDTTLIDRPGMDDQLVDLLNRPGREQPSQAITTCNRWIH